MAKRQRIKLSEEIDDELKARIKCYIKSVLVQKHYFTNTSFCREFSNYLKSIGKRINFTEKVFSNRLSRGDFRLYELLLMLDFLEGEILLTNKNQEKINN